MKARSLESKSLYRSGCLLLALMGGVAISGVAGASDAKYFNGAFCRVTHSPGVAPLTAEYRGNGAVANRNIGSQLTMVCPVVRDTVDNDDPWLSLKVGYFDKAPADAIECNAFVGSFADGTLLFPQQGFSQNTAGATWSTLGMSFGVNQASLIDAFYLIRCTVPRAVDNTNIFASGIAYYRITEP